VNPYSAAKYATGQFALLVPENQEQHGEHQAMDLLRGKGKVKPCLVPRLRDGTLCSGRSVWGHTRKVQ